MKSKLAIIVFVIGLGLAVPAEASMLVVDSDTFVNFSNQYSTGTVLYWLGADYNNGFALNLLASSPTYEGAWLDGLLDNSVPTAQYYDRWQAGIDFDDDLTTISLDTSALFDWEYAVVKAGIYWAAYYDDDNSNVLNYPDGVAPQQGISHITWFNAVAVPVPPTVILFGSGLICLLGFRRMRSKRS